MSTPPRTSDVAIIGIHGRFPGAPNVEKLWANLCAGVESLSRFSESELRESGVPPQTIANRAYVPVRGVLDDIDLFDPLFFGLTSREAEDLDPQHRLFLECCYEALELAGYAGAASAGQSISVFAGSGANTYLLSQLRGQSHEDSLETAISGMPDFLATRVAYKLNLRGPALTVQTACSTSLVAVHLACQSLLDGESDLAIAGGVAIGVPHRTGYTYQAGHILSPDGRCRPFDAEANGTVPSSGVGVVILKPLPEALRDRDIVHAVIKATAINNDGSAKVGFTAPGVIGQAAVVSEAIRLAGFDPTDISYIEAHGTGTAIGDPIEIQSLRDVFGNQGRCVIGSLKSNLGHLDAAAGVAGLIKTVLALKHRRIPATLHYSRPNPELHLESTPFYINQELMEWGAPEGHLLRAGVSSFGIGGTNAHAVLEEAPGRAASGPSRLYQPLVLSARTPAALEAAAVGLADFLEKAPSTRLADVAFTLSVCRDSFAHRAAIAARDTGEAANALRSSGLARMLRGRVPPIDPQTVFLFPGQGVQYPDAARGLYRSEPVFRDVFDRAADLLVPHLGRDIRDLLFVQPTPESEEALYQTAVTQPVVFAIEYALAMLLLEWNIRPAAMIGHSIGELVAACLAGVAPLEAMLELVAARGRLMQEEPPGAMVGVQLSDREAVKYEHLGVSIAASNSSNFCALSGPLDVIGELERRLLDESIPHKRLRSSHAFHSASMERAAQRFTEVVSKFRLAAPTIPYVSNLTGTWITEAEATSAGYYGAHLRQQVRFSEGLAKLLGDNGWLLLEVGPGSTLKSLAESHAAYQQQPVIATMRTPRQEIEDQQFLAEAVARYWVHGGSISWAGYYANEDRNRIELPTYPFERSSYWQAGSAVKPIETDERNDAVVYGLSWKSAPPSIARKSMGPWLVISQAIAGITTDLVTALRAHGQRVSSVIASGGWSQSDEFDFSVEPANGSHYDRLWRTLEERGNTPSCIVYGSLARDLRVSSQPTEEMLSSFEDLLCLAQSIPQKKDGSLPQLISVTADAHVITGTEATHPAAGLLAGAAAVIAQELNVTNCRVIDVNALGNRRPLIDALLAEVLADDDSARVCLRPPRRWEPVVEPLEPVREESRETTLKHGGAYLVIGDDGETARVLKDYLERAYQARVGLIASPISAAAAAGTTSAPSANGRHSDLLWPAKLDSSQELQAAFERAKQHLKEIDGVFHAPARSPGNLIKAKTAAQIRSSLEFHVKSLMALEEALEAHGRPTVVLLSSSAGLTGGLGQITASAASAFTDACANAWRYGRGWAATSIACDPLDWDTWPGGDLDAAPEMQAQIKQTLANYGISREHFERSLDLALRFGVPNVFVSRRDLPKVLHEYKSLKLSALLGSLTMAGTGARHPRPELDTPFVPPAGETEEKIAAIWQDLFGLDSVGANDSFFDLGGSSLLAIQLVARLRQLWGESVSMDVVFSRPTVAQLAEHFAPPPELSPEELAEVERLMAELNALPDDVRNSLLN
jgi:phthiocerol/phenolphthiocerol synthesis type-I polyketide synthase E